MPARHGGRSCRASGRESGSSGSCRIRTRVAAAASSTVSVRTEWLACMLAFEGPSGIRPGVGFRPTMLLSAAGTRPEPAASPPSARLDETGRNRDPAARGRAARDVVGREHAARDAVVGPHADQPHPELVHVVLADHHRARVQQVPDRGRGRGGDVLVGAAALRGRVALDVEAVLHAERQAEERVAVGRGARALQPSGRVERPLARHDRGPGRVGPARVDAGVDRLNHALGRQRAVAVGSVQGPEIEAAGLGRPAAGLRHA